MPVFIQIFKRQSIVSCRAKEIRNIMDERVHFNFLFILVKPGFLPIILSEGMKFIDEEFTARTKCPSGFGENKREILNMFQHKITDNQIKRLVLKIPRLGDIHP